MMPRARYIAIGFLVIFVLLRWYKTPRQQTTTDFGPLEAFNSTLGFQRIFAINLPARTDRRDVLTLAAALTGLNISFVDGVAGADVADSVLPGNGKTPMGFTVGNKGSWRAHMNVLQRIVQENITTALILEDDADWDIRIKSQMRVFAAAARPFTQPVSPSSSAKTPGWQPPSEATLADLYRHSSPNSEAVIDIPISRVVTMDLPNPHLSPYGDDWDLLWLGHCGTDFPEERRATDRSDDRWKPPPLRVTIPDDPTVPLSKYLVPHPFALGDSLGKQTFTGSDDEDNHEWVDGEGPRRSKRYAQHTRVVHAPRKAVCTQAYAVSQRGARRLLWRFGVGMGLTAGWDLVLSDWCDGVYASPSLSSLYGNHRRRGEGEELKAREGDGGSDDEEVDGDGRPPVCVTVQPPLFSHHFGRGKGSDISAAGGGFWKKKGEMTPYIRLSVRLNLGRLVNGMEPREQWDD
ncbi:hypothetical protein VTJ83DRAFT_7582 [Remersonia thermophila]|uniref:Glycosyl transferase family 25 domain-containing protein n=1 Tax=Remersonia thermophila TaxID=72144 RepID=A0ABR4D3X5_9PEZI